MAEGVIESFDEESGKGFIQPEEGGGKIPFDRKVVADHQTGDLITVGDRVTYDVEGGLAGDMAKEVRRVAPRGYE